LYRIEADAVIELSSGLHCSRNGASPPLVLAGRLVQEDFCLLQKRDGRYILTAAVLCFSAHWSLAEKIGRPLLDIHEPVPGFAEQLGSPVERLFERLDAARPVQRLNWSLVDTDDLYLPPSHRKAPVALALGDIGERLWLRVERQTLRRLPITGAVVFGIRTHVTPIRQAIDMPEAADALIQRLHELPVPMLTYKNLVSIRPALLAYLERRRDGVL
ncbi:MAG: heme-dependent oxidative N-demethylase family protein, partial [Geminicoccaceae bacterium]